MLEMACRAGWIVAEGFKVTFRRASCGRCGGAGGTASTLIPQFMARLVMALEVASRTGSADVSTLGQSMISICMDDFGGEVEDGTGRRDLPKTECEEDFFLDFDGRGAWL
jgi:hypothetical protein